MKYKIYIFDTDATLLDYNVSEKRAFTETMLECCVYCDKKMIDEFCNVCCNEWNKLKLNDTEDIFVQNNYHKLYYEYAINRFERLKEVFDIGNTASELSNIYFQKCFISEEIGY